MLVDLRHESTHQSLPSLPLLQLASLAALDWLYKHYWTAQSHAVTKVEDGIRSELREYKKARDRSTKSANKQQVTAGEDEETPIEVTINSNENILLVDSSSSNASSSSSTGTQLNEKCQEILRRFFSNITSGHSLQHTLTVVETKLIPIMLSDAFLIKPPKQR